MKIEFIFSSTSCRHCIYNYQKIIEILEDYPYKEEFITCDLINLEYPIIYELASKYGVLASPMIVLDGYVVFRTLPSKRRLLKILDKYKKNKCPAVEQNQIVFY